jgi:AmmeMemoRadiSam system protein A
MNLSAAQSGILLNLARQSIRAALRGEACAAQPPDDPALLAPAGCFVSLHEQGSGRLRGCVGRLDAADALHLAVTRAACSVLADPRFEDDRITIEQLPGLQIEISVLAPLKSTTNPLAFDPRNDGIYLTIGQRSGCFLPQVGRETGWTREQLLERLCTEKMALPPNAWRQPDAALSIFTAQIIGPEPF